MDLPVTAQPTAPWLGRSIPRIEDAALLTGRGRYFDDTAVASLGGRLLDGAARVIIAEFFAARAAKAGARRHAHNQRGLDVRLASWR
jgi:hypothetical protein